MDVDKTHHCGYAAIIGRPNVGKSTLLNKILGQKISITSPRPQTTRHRLLGIKTTPQGQAIYVDTPGLHRDRKRAINRYMNRAARAAITEVDVVVFVVEALNWTDEDQDIVNSLEDVQVPVIAVVNKVDKVADKSELLPFLQLLAEKRNFVTIIPLAARSGKGVERLEAEVLRLLPQVEPMFADDQITDRSERFLAAELIREKLTRRLGQELPYALTVEIENFTDEEGLARIQAIIWVERETQKAIVIGSGGGVLKEIGQLARVDMEKLFGRKVFLEMWVKVKEGWSENERLLRKLGYEE